MRVVYATMNEIGRWALEELAGETADHVLLAVHVRAPEAAREHSSHVPSRLNEGDAGPLLGRGDGRHGPPAVHDDVEAPSAGGRLGRRRPRGPDEGGERGEKEGGLTGSARGSSGRGTR